MAIIVKSFFIVYATLLLTVPTLSVYGNMSDTGNIGDTLSSDNNCYSTSWPHEKSSLEPDPSLQFGMLENGFRYVLKNNREPRNRVGVYLNIEAGSIYEQESERGIAHFLEHMLFNGTTHFKPGELIDYFQSIGMTFGADLNAYTSYTDTVYKMILPTGTTESLDQGFLVIRDYADGALLLEEEIERERGVILAEKTARDSAAYRSSIARTAFMMRNTPVPKRQPIGEESVLRNADRDDFHTFYKRWYRPDNMVLIAVGDFSLNEAEKLIEKHFASMSIEAEGYCPDYGRVAHHGIETFYHHEPEIGATDVFIETVLNKEPENDSFELQVRNLHKYMASMIINHRLQRLQESVDTSFSSAGYYDSALFDRFQISGIRARTKQEDWRDTLTQLDRILGQALRYGFLEEEVQRVKKELQADLQKKLLGQDTRNSLHIINQIIANLNRNRVMQSPEQEAALFKPVIEQVSVKELNESLRNSWQGGGRIVQVVGDAELIVDYDKDELRDFYAGLAARDIEPPKQATAIVFPYLPLPEKVMKPVNVIEYPDIGSRRIDFDNGLIVNIKKTDFKENQIRVALHFGDGRISLPEKGLDMLAVSLVNGSGTATLKRTQLEEALSGSSVWSRFRVGNESFMLEGQAISSEAELLFQMIYALLNDPGFRQEEYIVAMKNFDTMYRRLQQDVSGAQRLYVDEFFTSDAIASGLPDWQEFKKFERDVVVDWLKPYFLHAPLELSVVGDINEDKIIALAGKYFASLPVRTYMETSKPIAQFPVGQEFKVAIDTTIDKALVKFGWLTDDNSDIGRTRRLHVLAAVFAQRLRQKMREELGKSYSPSAYSVTSRIYTGYGALFAEVVVDNESIGIAREVLAGIGDSFAADPVEEAELERAREPIVTSLKDTARTNGYWLNSVLTLSSKNPQQLEWPTTLISEFDSISGDQVNEMARIYLRDDRRGIAVISQENDNSD